MSIDWFRWHHGSISDPKFTVVARKSGQPRALVVATWAALLETASQAEDRGSLEDVEIDTIAACLDVEEDAVSAIFQALIAKGMISNGRVDAWDRRQVYREDDSRDRVRRFRERSSGNASVTPGNGHVTHGNASVTPQITDTDTDKEKTNSPNGEYGDAGAPPPAPPRVVALDRTPYAAIVALYHEILPELRECRAITPGRRGYLRQRWRDKPGPDLAAWRRYFAYVRTSPFLMGQLAGRDGRPPFQADLEWLIKPGNFAKVIEGKFDAAEPVARHG